MNCPGECKCQHKVHACTTQSATQGDWAVAAAVRQEQLTQACQQGQHVPSNHSGSFIRLHALPACCGRAYDCPALTAMRPAVSLSRRSSRLGCCPKPLPAVAPPAPAAWRRQWRSPTGGGECVFVFVCGRGGIGGHHEEGTIPSTHERQRAHLCTYMNCREG